MTPPSAARPVPDPGPAEPTGEGHGPLFRKELLHGAGALSETFRARVLARLTEVACGRAAPLHAATAWNALYFGYDTARGSYTVQPDLDGLVPLGEKPRPSLPVGAFVVYDRGDHFLGGEVVASFGADPRVCADADGWVDPELPLVTREDGEGTGECPGRERVLEECSVVDWTVFGPLGADERNELLRCRRRAVAGDDTLLDARGHASGPAVHHPPRPAVATPGRAGVSPGSTPAGDLTAYAEHLLRRPALLGCGPIPDLFPGSGDQEQDRDARYRAVLASLTTVAELLASAPALLTWAGYASPESRYTQRVLSPGLLGGEDLRELVHRATRPAAGGTRFTAVLPALAGLVKSANARSVAEREAVLADTALAEAVVHANLMIHRSTQETGSTAWLREPWQGGGVWGSGPDRKPASVTDPDVSPEAETTPGDDPLADLSAVGDCMAYGMVTLRRSYLENGLLPLPEQVRAALRGREAVVVDLPRPRGRIAPGDAVRDGRITDAGLRLEWPAIIVPGQRALVGAAVGGCRIRIDVEDVECDEEAADSGAVDGTAASPGRAGMVDAENAGALRGIVLETIRLDGDPGDLGSRSMTADRLLGTVVEALAGNSGGSPLLRQAVLAACGSLVDGGLLQRTPGPVAAGSDETVEYRGPDTFTWWPEGVPSRGEEPGPLKAGSPDAPAAARVAQHLVSPFLRRLPPGRQASRRAESEYAKDARLLGVDPRLPEGSTYVRGHLRGGDSGPAVTPNTPEEP